MRRLQALRREQKALKIILTQWSPSHYAQGPKRLFPDPSNSTPGSQTFLSSCASVAISSCHCTFMGGPHSCLHRTLSPSTSLSSTSRHRKQFACGSSWATGFLISSKTHWNIAERLLVSHRISREGRHLETISVDTAPQVRGKNMCFWFWVNFPFKLSLSYHYKPTPQLSQEQCVIFPVMCTRDKQRVIHKQETV